MTGNGWAVALVLAGGLGLAAGLTACAAPVSPPATRTAPVEVGHVASPNPGSVNAYWVTAPQGLVVVDSGRNATMGSQVVDQTRRTGRPVVAIVITHSHPDHIGGLAALHQAYPAAPVYASQATITQMREDPLGFYPLARRDDPDFPARLTYPDRVVARDETLDLGGLELRTAEFDQGESESATAYEESGSGALFGGDLTDDHATPALLEGHTCAWLVNIDRLQARFATARTIHPGHGRSAPVAVQADEQRDYLHAVRGLVRPATAPGSPSGAAVDAGEQAGIVGSVERRFPGYPPVAKLPLPQLQQANIAAVARELATEDPATLPPTCRP